MLLWNRFSLNSADKMISVFLISFPSHRLGCGLFSVLCLKHWLVFLSQYTFLNLSRSIANPHKWCFLSKKAQVVLPMELFVVPLTSSPVISCTEKRTGRELDQKLLCGFGLSLPHFLFLSQTSHVFSNPFIMSLVPFNVLVFCTPETLDQCCSLVSSTTQLPDLSLWRLKTGLFPPAWPFTA